jgi:hypothetical protein
MILALVLLPPAPAHAQGTAEVQAYLLSVKRLYEDFENESALKQVTRAKTLTRTTDEDVTLSLYEGVIQADLNHWDESAAAFKQALTQRPKASLPVKVSPKVEQHFEKVRDQVNQELAAKQKPPAPLKPSPPEPKVVVQAPPERKPTALPVTPLVDAVSSPSTPVATRSFTRPQFLIPAIGGGVLLVLGGTSWAMSRQELSSLNNDDPKFLNGEDAHSAASRGRTLQSVGVGLLGAGVAGLGFAAGWYVFGPPSNETALTVGTNGTSAFVQGRWP